MTTTTKYVVEVTTGGFNGPRKLVTVEAESMTLARAQALRDGAYSTHIVWDAKA